MQLNAIVVLFFIICTFFEDFYASTVVTVIAKKQHKNKVSNFFIFCYCLGLCCKDINK